MLSMFPWCPKWMFPCCIKIHDVVFNLPKMSKVYLCVGNPQLTLFGIKGMYYFSSFVHAPNLCGILIWTAWLPNITVCYRITLGWRMWSIARKLPSGRWTWWFSGLLQVRPNTLQHFTLFLHRVLLLVFYWAHSTKIAWLFSLDSSDVSS